MVGFKVVVCAIFAIVEAAADAGCGFGYDGDLGPDHWGEYYEQCAGKHQSPINIDSAHVTWVSLPPFKMEGFEDASGIATLTNNGHTAMMTTDSEVKRIVSGGPLGAEYQFAQLHFHWGADDSAGSEDEIDGKAYPMEMHLVFFKKEYLTFDAATEYSDGLAVFAVLFEVDEIRNDNLDGFSQVLPEIINAETSSTFYVAPALINLLPDDLVHYFTYNGSLTTPPCAEIVTWIEFKTPVKLSHAQFESFRGLLNEEEHPMSNNFRAVQPLGDRIVLYNTEFDEFERDLAHDLKDLIGDAEDLLLKMKQMLEKF